MQGIIRGDALSFITYIPPILNNINIRIIYGSHIKTTTSVINVDLFTEMHCIYLCLHIEPIIPILMLCYTISTATVRTSETYQQKYCLQITVVC